MVCGSSMCQESVPEPLSSIWNLGLEYFYAAFSPGCFQNLQTSSARAFGISDNDISEDCSVPSGIAQRLRPLTHGTPCKTYIQKKAQIDPQEIKVQSVQEVKEEQSEFVDISSFWVPM